MYFIAKNLTGGYGEVKVIENCEFNVNRGEIVSILGPNGAGKSSAMKAMLGMLKLDSGKVILDGKDISDLSTQERIRLGISFVPQVNNIFSELTVKENLEMGAFTSSNNIEEKINSMYDLFPAINEKKTQLAGELSGGQRQQVAIARALMNNPSILMLDEPTAGVDISLRRSMWSFLKEQNRQGLTIILTTHYLEEAEHLCKNVAIINHGKLIANTTMKQILNVLKKC